MRMTVRRWAKNLAKVALVNAAILVLLLVPVELIFGTWLRSFGLEDLKRFSIPIDVRFQFDTSALYGPAPGMITYSRDQYGLRGNYGDLKDVEILTIGGSTTEQRYIDDAVTWQELASAELTRRGKPNAVVNAGVDGQSTVGHLFDFDHWFPLLPELRPKVIVFYVGANDVLRHETRQQYDGSLDAASWRVRSATFQLFRTIRDNRRARTAHVMHGRMREVAQLQFTTQGTLSGPEQGRLAGELTELFMSNVRKLRQRAQAMGAMPIFMTQTAFGWNADHSTPRGVVETVRILDLTVNFADVAFFHQHLNRALMASCLQEQTPCFDVANEVHFEAADYYDYLHNTPQGVAKIGAYLGARLATLDLDGAR